jgi:hypothetical protein
LALGTTISTGVAGPFYSLLKLKTSVFEITKGIEIVYFKGVGIIGSGYGIIKGIQKGCAWWR